MTEITRSCCSAKPPQNEEEHNHPHHKKARFDYIYVCSLAIIAVALLVHFLIPAAPQGLHHFAHTIVEILGSMWWGIALGIVIIGLMNKIPREYFTGLMGKSGSLSGLFRAIFGGLLLDLCCHGILLVAAKLYERGVSTAQVVTFLVASPWNSISLTLVLIGLIGFQWTMLYVLGSMAIALLTGFIFQLIEKRGMIAPNPNTLDIPSDFNLMRETKTHIKGIRFSKTGVIDILKSGWKDGQMIIKWLLFGTILAAAMRSFIPADIFQDWFGPTVAGLFVTVIVATIIEICSEGSAPVAGELFTQAGAPGNAFAFLMAGVATDYTEILAIREFTKSWKIAFLLPAITVPQVLFIGWIMNMAVQ
jgi:uncharacterized protein